MLFLCGCILETFFLQGTGFMDRLAVCLRFYISDRLTNDPGWKNIKVNYLLCVNVNVMMLYYCQHQYMRVEITTYESALEITSVRQTIKMIGRTQFQPII